MLGWINDCVEKLVIDKFGVDVWHQVKEKAGCDVNDNGFLKLEHYPDKSTYDLVAAACELSGLSQDQVYEAFGSFFVYYIMGEGYEDLLCCQGSTLKDWMRNINAIHQHLQTTFPKKMTMPEFWCDENIDGTITLYYRSSRGNVLAPLAVGLISEVAKHQFELDIVMDKILTQGVDHAKHTSWIVSTKDPKDIPLLGSKVGGRNGIANAPTALQCPMSGMKLNSADIPDFVVAKNHSVNDPEKDPSSFAVCPHATGIEAKQILRKESMASKTTKSSVASMTAPDILPDDGGISSSNTRKLFPYHVMLNADFEITQTGVSLPMFLGTTEKMLHGNEIDEIFEFVRPSNAKWTRSWFRKLEDQEFLIASILGSSDNDYKQLKGSIVIRDTGGAMLILCPEANSLQDLREMNLTLSDLPPHGAYRDEVFLREHLSKQMNNTLKMEKLSHKLAVEKELLESLIPAHAAEGLRKGKSVQPRMHSNVTMFFSDIVGFTNMCKQINPRQIIETLNHLYGIMDYLADFFQLFKVETIGDAYFCVSGLPESNPNHAINVANFAVAVSHFSRFVINPADGSPIKLRIGIHSGSCASGIVGTTNPRYCVFGDTVNTTARHESTGEAGRIHCSTETRDLLRNSVVFSCKKRGLVEMKGKGKLKTFWLSATQANGDTGSEALDALGEQLKKKFPFMADFDPPKEVTTLKNSSDSDSVVSTSASSLSEDSSASQDRRLRRSTESVDSKSALSLNSTASSTPSRKDVMKLLARNNGGSTRRRRNRVADRSRAANPNPQ